MATPGNDQDKQSDTDKQEDLWYVYYLDTLMEVQYNKVPVGALSLLVVFRERNKHVETS